MGRASHTAFVCTVCRSAVMRVTGGQPQINAKLCGKHFKIRQQLNTTSRPDGTMKLKNGSTIAFEQKTKQEVLKTLPNSALTDQLQHYQRIIDKCEEFIMGGVPKDMGFMVLWQKAKRELGCE